MFRVRNLVVSGVLGVALALGCTVNTDGSDRDRGSDGTVEVDPNESSATALVTGRIEGAISGDFQISVNDSPRTVDLAEDGSFVVREVPADGPCVFAIAALGLRGSLTIDDVHLGEVIEVLVRVEIDRIVITIVRRNTASEPPREVDQQSGAPLEISANHICYYLRPGVYDRDVVITGHHVALLGNASCADGQRSVLRGTLRVTGHHDLVQDVDLRGSVVVNGHHDRIADSCTRCFAEQCMKAGGSCGDACRGAIGSACTADDPCPGACSSDCKSGGGPGSSGGPPAEDDAGAVPDGDASTDGGTGADAGSDGGNDAGP
jgi:hypothetical protein